jgi:hypothetical protein
VAEVNSMIPAHAAFGEPEDWIEGQQDDDDRKPRCGCPRCLSSRRRSAKPSAPRPRPRRRRREQDDEGELD